MGLAHARPPLVLRLLLLPAPRLAGPTWGAGGLVVLDLESERVLGGRLVRVRVVVPRRGRGVRVRVLWPGVQRGGGRTVLAWSKQP